MDRFCCPVCKGSLVQRTAGFQCAPCGRAFAVLDGVPDFFISETERDFIDEPNKTWLDPDIVQARDTVYRICTRELKGMEFCMREIGRRTGAGCRVLEAGMGTGHFTRWLAEVSRPGTEIYAFDFSWPIIEQAKANTQDLSGVTLFRANARGSLPFQNGSFDILLLRLAPLGAHGVPNVQAAYELLRPGGWYFEAGWEQAQYETPPVEWALQHGYERAEHHAWAYWRTQSEQEARAAQLELGRLAAQGNAAAAAKVAQGQESGIEDGRRPDGAVRRLTREHLLIAQKPL